MRFLNKPIDLVLLKDVQDGFVAYYDNQQGQDTIEVASNIGWELAILELLNVKKCCSQS
jgi:hypothetical protein